MVRLAMISHLAFYRPTHKSPRWGRRPAPSDVDGRSATVDRPNHDRTTAVAVRWSADHPAPPISAESVNLPLWASISPGDPW